MIEFAYFLADGRRAMGVEMNPRRETCLKTFETHGAALDFCCRAEEMRTRAVYDDEVFRAIDSEAQARAEA